MVQFDVFNEIISTDELLFTQYASILLFVMDSPHVTDHISFNVEFFAAIATNKILLTGMDHQVPLQVNVGVKNFATETAIESEALPTFRWSRGCRHAQKRRYGS